jgi:carboxyl-terminal processing protease
MAEARLVQTARVKEPRPPLPRTTMTTRTRWIVLLVSTPVVAFVVIGSLLGRTLASQGAYEHLRVFEDVVSLVTQNYVEPVNVDKVMTGAMRGLADGLDADSAYLTPEQVKTFEAERAPAPGTTGLELTRGYYLRIVSARDGSPAARAGLRTGDYVRAINGAPTRNLSALEGMRLLRGPVGSTVTITVLRGSATDPRDIPLVREAAPATDVTSKVQTPGVGYVRVAAFTPGAAGRLEQAVAQLTRGGAASVIVDLRDTAEGRLEEGIAAARPFVPAGKTLSTRETKAGKDSIVTTTATDGKVTTPLVLLTTNGTSGAAELFAAALLDNKRATLVGEHTLGRAGVQKLVKLPDGSAIYMTFARYLAPSGTSIHGTGLTPTVDVEQPEREFGAAAPTTDPILDKALEQLRTKKAA